MSGALAVLFGLAIWPGHIAAVTPLHQLTGYVVILSLWILAAIASRRGVSRATALIAAGWGLMTLLVAMAQYVVKLGDQQWMFTVLHAATGIGALGFGRHLVTQTRTAAAVTRSQPATGTQQTIADAASEFLAKRRIAVTGVSRKAKDHGSNIVYKRLRERGYEVFAVNPNADRVEGDRCFRDLRSIPGGVDAVVIATRAAAAMGTVQECAELGIQHVWMHRSVGPGSVSEEAAAWGRQRGLHVIPGGCPLMFDPVADTGHKIMRPLFTLTGKVPRRV